MHFILASTVAAVSLFTTAAAIAVPVAAPMPVPDYSVPLEGTNCVMYYYNCKVVCKELDKRGFFPQTTTRKPNTSTSTKKTSTTTRPTTTTTTVKASATTPPPAPSMPAHCYQVCNSDRRCD